MPTITSASVGSGRAGTPRGARSARSRRLRARIARRAIADGVALTEAAALAGFDLWHWHVGADSGPFAVQADGAIADIIREAYPKLRKLPTREMPNFAVRLLSIFDDRVRAVLPDLGTRHIADAAYVSTLTGVMPRPAREAVLATLASLAASYGGRFDFLTACGGAATLPRMGGR